MNSEFLARRMREEHARVDDLSRNLHEWVAVIPRANFERWIEETRKRFEAFRAHLIKQFALEEREGYLKAVVDRRPTLSTEVERLAHEHAEMVRLLDGLHQTVQDLKPTDRLLMRDCVKRLEMFLGYLEHHENDENLLVTFVFTHDVGTKD